MRNYFLFFIILLIYITSQNATASIRNPFVSYDSLTTMKKPLLHEKWIQLYYVNASKILSFLKIRLQKLSSNYELQADDYNNQIWIKDSQINIQKIESIISHLDKPTKQFLIKAQIVMIDKRYQNSLGVQFNTIDTNSSHDPYQSAQENPKNTFSLAVAKLTHNQLLNVKISALEQTGHATVISKPVLMTLNKKSASIESGAEIPYQQETISGATSVSFKKAVLSLNVTPQYLPNNDILLRIGLTQDKVSSLTVNGVPAIQTQQMHTQVITKNKQMIILGGIFENTHANQSDAVPVLSHVPILGLLFKNSHRENEQQMLIICISTQILP